MYIIAISYLSTLCSNVTRRYRISKPNLYIYIYIYIYSAPPLFITPLICHPRLLPTICQSPIFHHVISTFNLLPAPSHFANQSHAQMVHFAIGIPHYFANLPLCTNFSKLIDCQKSHTKCVALIDKYKCWTCYYR